MNPNQIKKKLNEYHKKKTTVLMDNFSNIAGNQFPGEFNVSGFHKQILELPDKPQSIWGIDRCLRIQEIPDQLHAYLFHMAIYAKSIDLQKNFINPFKDERFHQLQKEIISQFLEILSLFMVDMEKVEITYLDGLTFGGASEGKDRLLESWHTFPSDNVSKKILQNKIKLWPVKSIANLDINAEEGSLVGLRLEIAYKGIEIGTIVFDCFRIQQGKLQPINYVSGYAIGIERLAAALDGHTLFQAIPRYSQAIELLTKSSKVAKSSLFEKEVLAIIFAAEAIAAIPKKVSEKQQERVRKLKKDLKKSVVNLGLDEKVFKMMIIFFKRWNYL